MINYNTLYARNSKSLFRIEGISYLILIAIYLKHIIVLTVIIIMKEHYKR